MKRFIMAMGTPRKDIMDSLENNTLILVQHLLKIYWYESTGNIIHWKEELPKWNSYIPKVKGKNKYLDSKSIELTMLNDILPRFDRVNNGIKHYYIDKRPTDNKSDAGAKSFVLDYISWLSESLSSQGQVDNYVIWDKVDELLVKYK